MVMVAEDWMNLVNLKRLRCLVRRRILPARAAYGARNTCGAKVEVITRAVVVPGQLNLKIRLFAAIYDGMMKEKSRLIHGVQGLRYSWAGRSQLDAELPVVGIHWTHVDIDRALLREDIRESGPNYMNFCKNNRTVDVDRNYYWESYIEPL